MSFITYTLKKYDAKLLFTDIDSLIHEFKIDEFMKIFFENKGLFDFSDYPEDSKLFNPVNKKVIGKIKDEFKGKIISEFVGLKLKVYPLVTVNNEETKNAKGVNKNIVKKNKA